VDFEGIVRELIEGEENTNAAQINELGNTFRSTHDAGMIPNGMIGAMIVEALTDVCDRERILFSKGELIKVGAGRMPHDQRKHYFQHPDQILGTVVKGKFFPKGIKDKPRFPTFQAFRDAADMGGE
jgi:DNA ligase-1